jgi:hypothetical protein
MVSLHISIESLEVLRWPMCALVSLFCFGRMCGVLRTVQCCGDYERLMQGVYENFLNMSFRDSRLEAVRYVNLLSLHLCIL